MLTEKDYCDYETCVALKELGYVGICDAYYELTGTKEYNRDSFEILYTREFIHPDDIDRVAAPLLYQAQKWLREEKDAHIVVKPTKGKYYCTILLKDKIPMLLTHENIVVRCFDSYEEALSEGIKEAVKILKENETIYKPRPNRKTYRVGVSRVGDQ